MGKKNNFARSFLQLISPKVGSTKWLSNATKERILAYREEMWNKLMDPNEDMELRMQIRNHIMPRIDRELRKRDR